MTFPLDDQARIPQQQAGSAPTGIPVPPAPATRSRRWWWIVAAVAALVAGGLFVALRPSDSDEASDRCRSEITGKLKSPSTVQFGESTVAREEGDFGTYYEVTGVLDAQNGFGAMIRSSYRCKVTQETGGRWLVTESTVSNG